MPRTREDPPDDAPVFVNAHDLVLQPSVAGAHCLTLVLLHSRSGGPEDCLAYVHRLEPKLRQRLRIVAPCAPWASEEQDGWEGTLNSWFAYGTGSRAHGAQLVAQCERILALVERERGFLPEGDGRRIVLGGLSQGASLAIEVACRASFELGGVLALRGCVLQETLDAMAMPARQTAEVLAFHGELDSIVPLEEARTSYQELRARGMSVDFRSDPFLAHACARGRQAVSAEETRCIGAFLSHVWQRFAD